MLISFVCIVGILTVLYTYAQLRARGRTPLPPGPSSLPVIGNVHQLPLEYQERTFYEWGQKYGGIVFARLFYKPAIVINSLQVARDLMDKRSGNYSDRPVFTLLEDMMGWKNIPTQLRYGEKYRKHRRWMQDAFISKSALLNYQPMQRRETYILLSALVESPEACISHMRRHAAGLVIEIVYGHKISGLDDEYVQIAERAGTETVRVGSPGSSVLSLLVDFFPFLKYYPLWLPGSGFKVKTNEIKALVERLRHVPYDAVKQQMSKGIAPPSFVASVLDQYHDSGDLTAEDEEDIKGASSTFYAAGIDTTTSVLASFLLNMVLNRDVFKKAQLEIDTVIGNDRLPDFEDRESLPYLNAIIKEVYRWTAPVPLAIPHRSMEADEYQGLYIPAGSMIIPNVWGMSRDPGNYPDPEEFRPERFLDNAGRDDPNAFVFGFGRRLCPGQMLADSNVYLIMSNIIATMDISKARDDNGEEITPSGKFTSGFVRHPLPFEFCITPRSSKAKELIAHMHSSI